MHMICERVVCCCVQVEALVYSSGGFAVTAAYSSMHRWAGCDIHRTLRSNARPAVCAAHCFCRLAEKSTNVAQTYTGFRLQQCFIVAMLSVSGSCMMT